MSYVSLLLLQGQHGIDNEPPPPLANSSVCAPHLALFAALLNQLWRHPTDDSSVPGTPLAGDRGVITSYEPYEQTSREGHYGLECRPRRQVIESATPPPPHTPPPPGRKLMSSSLSLVAQQPYFCKGTLSRVGYLTREPITKKGCRGQLGYQV